MGILENFENAWDPEFQYESASPVIKTFSDSCSNGCACQSSSDHNKEFVLEEIDFEQ